MNFEPPDYAGYEVNGQNSREFGKSKLFQGEEDCSPLLRTTQQQNNNPMNLPRPQSRFKSTNSVNSHNEPQNFRNKIYQRLGNNKRFFNRNVDDNAHSNDISWRNRKRAANPYSVGPQNKVRFTNDRQLNSSNIQRSHTSVQNRIEKIRNDHSLDMNEDIQIIRKNDSAGSSKDADFLNDTQDIDATDFTVQVVNSSIKDDAGLTRFKLLLDPKIQKAIKVIQMKRKDKQVIFPFPVTPSSTEISLHERFSLL